MTRLEITQRLKDNAHKVGRIFNGDPNWSDSRHDMAGYAQLVPGLVYMPLALLRFSRR